MCGIFGYIGKNDKAGDIVLDGLKNLEYRGYDSWGIAIDNSSKKLLIEKHLGKIGQAKNINSDGNLAIGHTRWATHGRVTLKNSHPHLAFNGQIAVVHNGIVENYEVLKKDLIKKGYKFKSETDSEVIGYLIEELAKRMNFRDAFKKAFLVLEGFNAIVVLSGLSRSILAAKLGSPLALGFGDAENFISSDVSSFLKYTQKAVFLEDNQMVEMTDKEIVFFDLISNKMSKPIIKKIDWQNEDGEIGSYPDFMTKEIFEQPRVISSYLNGKDKQFEDLAEIIKKSFGAYLVGCGTAAYACLAGTYLFSKIAKRHINFAVGSEFGFLTDFLTNKSLIIALSQSGETMDTLDSVDKAKDKGAKIMAIVNSLNSTLHRKSDYQLFLNAGPEKCVVSTKAFTAKISVLLLLAYCLDGGLAEGKKLLGKAVLEIEKLLKNNSLEKIKKLAKKLNNCEHLYIIGRGISYPIALESALKIKEVSYLHAEGFAAGELKHGVIALIEKGTSCLVFAPNDETYGAVLSGAMEMKARGGKIIGVSFKNHEIFDEFIEVGDAGIATAIPNVVVAQLLGYYLCQIKGYDPDKPRNLAKSVTVK